MGTPYRATKDHNATPGMPFDAKEGDVAYLEGRPPAGWEPVEVDLSAPAAEESEEAPDLTPARPSANAPKGDWQAYVAALGVPAEEIDGKTTKELQARADEREAELEAETEAAEEAAAKASGGK